MFAPTLMLYANEEQKKRLLPPIAKAEAVYCQGWSEPDAGSDLANIQTMAEQEGDDYVINGQKLWTTGAHRADHIFLLARTDPDSKRSKGLSVFNINISPPGIEIRPIKYMNGVHLYNEVFFTNVRVHKSELVGPENGGWQLTLATMNFERSGVAGFVGAKKTLLQIVQYMKTAKRGGKFLYEDSSLRQRMAKLYAEIKSGNALCYRIAWNQHRGGLSITPHIASESKVFNSEVQQRMYNLGTELRGLFGPLNKSKRSKLKGKMIKGYQDCLKQTIAAGSSEIQRNIIAWSGADLPRFK